MNNQLINDIDEVLQDFIHGNVDVDNYQQYTALERIAVIVNKYRNQEFNQDKVFK